MVDSTNPNYQNLCAQQQQTQQMIMDLQKQLSAAKAKATKGEACCGSCAAGGPCDSDCPGSPPEQIIAECYKGCKTISKCLRAFYRDARLRTDSFAWLEYNKQEIPLVHINVSVGGAPNYAAATPPLVQNTNYMLMQERRQWLPYEPGFFKIDLKWLNDLDANAGVTVRIWTGPYDAQSVTTTPEEAGLILIGRELTLSDFFVVTNAGGGTGGGCCWFFPYPELFGCDESAIPNGRRVFFELRIGAVGQAQITTFQVAIVKRYTRRFFQMCKQYTGLEGYVNMGDPNSCYPGICG